MLGAERHPAVGVVVEEREVVAPAHPHRETRGQQDLHDALETRGPGAGGTERRGRPVVPAHEVSHLAAAGKRIVLGNRRHSARAYLTWRQRTMRWRSALATASDFECTWSF